MAARESYVRQLIGDCLLRTLYQVEQDGNTLKYKEGMQCLFREIIGEAAGRQIIEFVVSYAYLTGRRSLLIQQLVVLSLDI
jgi:hypothetical protein